jgi:hypothetical protein
VRWFVMWVRREMSVEGVVFVGCVRDMLGFV